MALIKCPECGREISDTASACPGCGAPVRKPGCLVHFERPRAMLVGSAVNGVVYVDGQQVGSASNGASFDVYLTYGAIASLLKAKLPVCWPPDAPMQTLWMFLTVRAE